MCQGELHKIKGNIQLSKLNVHLKYLVRHLIYKRLSVIFLLSLLIEQEVIK